VRAIERTDRDLTGIAHASGFADHPHMCREIRQTTGLTPGELRKLARRG
jgi:AraC-like DNA-binding protein